MSNPLKELHRLGTSPWIDMISRELLDSGGLKRMIEEDGLKGLTSNPTIFDKAISKGADYDSGLRAALAQGLSAPEDIFEVLAIRDIRDAADQLAPVYADSDGADGFVSLEVSPKLAYDTRGTIAAAERLFAAVDRRNLMIKVPAAKEGLPAVERLIAAGINVNVTLIFSVDRYREVMEAYLRGLEGRAAAGKPLNSVASVASFFISRIDSAVDKALAEKQAGSPLLGTIALANAEEAYAAFSETFASERFAKLRKLGAKVQRPLWASTSTKNPAYPDVLYVERLIGPDTVNTIPPETWAAFRDHGKPRRTLGGGLDSARARLALLAKAGVSLSAVTDRLEKDGIESFRQSFESMLAHLAEKAARMSAAEKKTEPAPAL